MDRPVAKVPQSPEISSWGRSKSHAASVSIISFQSSNDCRRYTFLYSGVLRKDSRSDHQEVEDALAERAGPGQGGVVRTHNERHPGLPEERVVIGDDQHFHYAEVAVVLQLPVGQVLAVLKHKTLADLPLGGMPVFLDRLSQSSWILSSSNHTE